MRRAIGLALAALALVAAKSGQPAFPPYAGAYQPQGVDERGLWSEADESERTLRDSEFVIRDAALNAYIREVLCRAVGTERCGGVRLYVLRVPEVNASMAPNGTMIVWSGILLRARTEAELAFILSHEFAHFELRHTLGGFRQKRMASDIAMWASFAGANAALLQNAAIGSTYQFSREQETAADIQSYGYIAASDYRPSSGSDFWRRMMDEADATALGRKQRSTRYDRVSFFATHPTDLQRATYLKTLADKQGGAGDDGAQRYAAAMARWQPEFLADQLKRNDFEGTEYLLGQLGADGWTPPLLFARGELYRMRGNPRDLVAAAGFYRAALAGGGSDPAIRRGLGLALIRGGDSSGGREALGDYLRLSPDAPDKAMIATLLN